MEKFGTKMTKQIFVLNKCLTKTLYGPKRLIQQICGPKRIFVSKTVGPEQKWSQNMLVPKYVATNKNKVEKLCSHAWLASEIR